ncbi:ATP-binding protein [Larkinella insperata]|uniref:histidine kinase n=1 Tax=Larkinella insperata TaxID=332158 RepID=A0ABW3Q768_9BACT
MRFCAFLYLGFQLLSSLLLTAGFAQSVLPRTTQLTMAQGLPHNTVTGMEQDRAGFIWIATLEGLARYDGQSLKIFRHRPGDNTSLINNKITQFDKASDGSFILGTEAGSFQRFDPITERFTTLLDRQWLDQQGALINQAQLSVDRNHLWGLLPGVRLIDYDITQKSLRLFDVPTLTGQVNDLSDFILTTTGYIYAETQTGLLQFDTRSGRKRIVPFPFRTISRWQEAVFTSADRHQVTLGPNGQIAVFGYDVIALYDPKQDRFRTIPIPDALAIPTSKEDARKRAHSVSYMIKRLADDRLYVGYGNRLYRLDGNGQLTLLHQSESSTSRLAPRLVDLSGSLWVSDESTGLIRLDLHPLRFNFVAKKKAFAEDLIEQDLGARLPSNFEAWDNQNWPRYRTDHAGTGYLIDIFRVYRHQVASRTITELTNFQEASRQMSSNLCLKESRSPVAGAGAIWVYNSQRGLIAIRSGGTKSFLYPNSLLPLTHLGAEYDAGDIQPIGQAVWVGSTYGLGLFRYDISQQCYDTPLRNNPQSVNSLPVNSINCLSADPTDSTMLWIGTIGGGLCRLDTRTMTFRRLGEAEGFPNGTIQSMETDGQGRLWCATNRGLVRVNPKTLTWRHFTTADGLPSDAFSRTSSARLPDGRLVFGTTQGQLVFDPKTIPEDTYEPPVVLTALLINNMPVDAHQSESQRSGVAAPINALPELVLDHTQNFLTIAFAGLDYSKTEKLSYRYRLNGVDDAWVVVGPQKTANYTQLAPGRYVFSVNSTRADGQWSREIKQLAIIIKPPLWATWWAYLLYVLAFGGLVLGFIRFQIKQARQQQEIRLKRRQAEHLRAVDEVKTRFFSNITHEFRTPLTLILAPTAQLLTNPAYDGFTRQTLATIHQHASQLLRLINQLLDLSKLEGGSMNVALSRGDALAFVQRLVSQFQPLAASRGIDLHLQTAGRSALGAGASWLFDADKWDKIISNLLSNALKFTPAGGQVSLTMEVRPSPDATADQLVIELADTGIGLTPEQLSRIFERFYQVNDSPTRPYEGTGIGLSLVKELTDLLGGTIRVQSRTQPPTGTTFILTLPLVPATHPAGAPELILAGPQPEENRAASGRADTKPETPGDVPLVLVVEDHQELRQFIAGELLSRYRVLTAADGQEGWQICQRELPDVVIADVMMPRMDGYQLTQRIRSTLATNHLAVILLTARAAYESRLAGLERGADDYVTKPFQLDELVLRLGNLLTRQANLRANLHRQLVSGLTPVQEPVTDGLITQLHQIIESRLSDPTFGVEDLAQGVAMSRRTLHRKLRALAELSAHDFIRHYRLQRARQLLRSGRSIAQTAYDVGFESPAYFTKIFKETYQQTPSEFVGRKMDK